MPACLYMPRRFSLLFCPSACMAVVHCARLFHAVAEHSCGQTNKLIAASHACHVCIKWRNAL